MKSLFGDGPFSSKTYPRDQGWPGPRPGKKARKSTDPKKLTKVRKFNLRNCHWKFWNAYEVWKKNDDFFKIQENICLMLLLISIELDCFFLMWSLRASSPHIRVYSTELCSAAPRDFVIFLGAGQGGAAPKFCGAGRPVFLRGGAGRSSLVQISCYKFYITHIRRRHLECPFQRLNFWTGLQNNTAAFHNRNIFLKPTNLTPME